MTVPDLARGEAPPSLAARAGTAFHRNAVPLICALAIAALAVRGWVDAAVGSGALRTWVTMFASISFQALPFLVFGVVLSGLMASTVLPVLMRRALPSRPLIAVPAAGLAGLVLPGCECASVPVAGRMIRSGLPSAAALTFLLSAPAINPVVLVSTAVAFPRNPEMVWARFGASLTLAVVMGWWWQWKGDERWMDRVGQRGADEGRSRWSMFQGAVVHDVFHAGGYLMVGAIAAATLQTFVPRQWLDSVADQAVLAPVALGLLAVALAVCSEADAFVAAGLSSFSLSARLAFLVVGPAVDVKLVSMQAGTLGRRFAARFAPLTFAVAIATSTIFGAVLL